MTLVKTKLAVAETPHPAASVLEPAVLPLFIGNEQEDLLCGGCEAVLCKSVSQLTTKTRFAVPNQLIVICPRCQTKNVLPSTLAPQT